MSGYNESLSIQQAQKLVLLSQQILSRKSKLSAIDRTLSTIEHLGYVQIDTISVVERAHHHTLWNRNAHYQSSQLDQLVADKKVFEYWSHAAAYLPMQDYRFSLWRKNALASGQQAHWYERDEPMMKKVIKRITEEGPLMAKDFEGGGKRIGEWQPKPAKRALEYLFMQGELMVTKRINFHKVYDLTERVLPMGLDTSLPDDEDYARFLIASYLRANGLGQVSEIVYLLKKIKPRVTQVAKEMLAAGELLKVNISGTIYYALPDSLKLLDQPLLRSRLKILSPFDNLVIQRKRMKALFDFDYLIECYLPASKRRYGYFSLPILWNGKLVARIDCKTDRNQSLLHIFHLALEPDVSKLEPLFLALRKELKAFLQFNQCRKVRLHKTTPTKVKGELVLVLKALEEPDGNF